MRPKGSKSGPRVSLTCKVCGQAFSVIHCRKDTALYCSRTCLDAASVERYRALRVEKVCPRCDIRFWVKPSHVGTRLYCSMTCRNAADSEKRPPNYAGPSRMAMGYVIVDHPSGKGRIYEHRLVAEQVIGRPLCPGEVVHHRDENRANNHPDNLQVMTRAEHNRLHKGANAGDV